MNTFREILGVWPSVAELARDCGVRWQTVHQWRKRNSIPPTHWAALCGAARRRGIEGVTLETLAQIAARREAA